MSKWTWSSGWGNLWSWLRNPLKIKYISLRKFLWKELILLNLWRQIEWVLTWLMSGNYGKLWFLFNLCPVGSSRRPLWESELAKAGGITNQWFLNSYTPAKPSRWLKAWDCHVWARKNVQKMTKGSSLRNTDIGSKGVRDIFLCCA